MEAPGPNKSVNREKEERRKKKKEKTLASYAKIWGKHNFSYVSFPEVGQKQKT